MIQCCALLSFAAEQHPSAVPLTYDSMTGPGMLLQLLAVIALTAHKLQLTKQAVTHAALPSLLGDRLAGQSQRGRSAEMTGR